MIGCAGLDEDKKRLNVVQISLIRLNHLKDAVDLIISCVNPISKRLKDSYSERLQKCKETISFVYAEDKSLNQFPDDVNIKSIYKAAIALDLLIDKVKEEEAFLEKNIEQGDAIYRQLINLQNKVS